jgi:TonB family protein
VKHNDPKNPKKKNFLRIPTYPGGKDAYLKFISENIVYPEQALSNKIEGFVYLVYTVNNIGEISDIQVTKGIGYGCDEEAVRVISMMQYEPARNRGIKMKVEMKTKIHFKLPETLQSLNPTEVQVNYSSPDSDKANSPEPKPQAVYNYTINLGT